MALSKVQTVVGMLAAVAAIGLHTGRAAQGPPSETAVSPPGDALPPGAVARLGTLRFRTGGFGLSGLGFLPDGKTLVAAPAEGHAVQLWDVATGKLRHEFSTRPVFVRSFALSPDGKYFALGSFIPRSDNQPARGAVGIWETASGKPVRTLPRDAAEVNQCALAFTQDGKRLATLGGNGVLRIEEVATGAGLLRQQLTRTPQPGLVFSPDGSTLVAASPGPGAQKLYLWKWQTEKEPRELNGAAGHVLAFSPDGRQLAECPYVGPTVRLWDVAGGRVVQQLQLPEIENRCLTHVAFSPDGKTLAVTSYTPGSSAVHLWDLAAGRHRARLDGAGGALAVSPDSRLLATGGAGAIRLWDLDSGKDLTASVAGHRSAVSQLAVAADFIATAGDDGTVRVWDAATGKPGHTFRHGNWVRAVAFSPDGSRLVTSSLDDTVCLWDVATGRRLHQLPGHGRLGGHRAVCFTADGKQFLSWGDDLGLRKWDAATGKAVLEHALRPTGVDLPGVNAGPVERAKILGSWDGTFSADGTVLVLSRGRQLHVFDTATGKDQGQIHTEEDGVAYFALAPDGKVLLTSENRTVRTPLPDGGIRQFPAKDHQVSLWELASGKLLRHFELPEGLAGPVAFAPDGRHFAAASDRPGPWIRVWETATRREIRAFRGFGGGPVRALTFTADGRRLVSGMEDTTALVWDLTGPAAR
jgi:WD40 repeat protein